MQKPEIIDNGVDAIIVSVDGMPLHRWDYSYPAERMNQVAMARAYTFGWAAAMRAQRPSADLLAALKALLLWFVPSEDTLHDFPDDAAIRAVLVARAAVAKAEGRGA